MTQTVSVDEAQNKLPDLLAQALAGNEVIITDCGKQIAPLVSLAPSKKRNGLPVSIAAQSGFAKILTNRYRTTSGSGNIEEDVAHTKH